MKKAIIWLMLTMSAFVLIGCATQPGKTAILNVFSSADKFNNNWMLEHKHYEAMTPLAKDSDWSQMGGWFGGQSDSGHGIHLTSKGDRYLSYDIDFYTSISPYTEADRALERGDEGYLRQYYNSHIGKITINKEVEQKLLRIEYFGKENYPCEVREFLRPASNAFKAETYCKQISCSKFNPEKTMAKTVGIELIYTRVPNLPKELEPLAKEYTYEDLQKRAQRILDSLYIKDGWEK